MFIRIQKVVLFLWIFCLRAKNNIKIGTKTSRSKKYYEKIEKIPYPKFEIKLEKGGDSVV